MGKILIIKGADFSENALERELIDIDITSELTFAEGIHGITTAENERYNSVYPRFDISGYKELGYTNIKVTLKTAGVYPFFTIVETGSAGTNYPISGSGYLEPGVYEASLSDYEAEEAMYFGVNIDTRNAGIHSALSDYMKVELLCNQESE